MTYIGEGDVDEVYERPGFIPVCAYATLQPLDGEIGCINGRRYVVR